MGWVEIFAGGEQRASDGATWDGDWLIDRAIETFDRAAHEPPLVLGHPADDAPAFGWVEGLREKVRDGRRILEAKIERVPEAAREALETGPWKKRSAAFYPDGRLRHVGALGAAVPAVKGLAPAKFKDAGAAYAAFGLEEQPLATAGATEGGREMDKEKGSPEGPRYSQEELDRRVKDAEARAKAKAEKDLEAKFAEETRKRDRAARDKEIGAKIDGLIAEGKLPPAFKEKGLAEFCRKIDSGGTIEFAEGEAKQYPGDRLLAMLTGLGELPIFKEAYAKGAEGKEAAEFAEAKEAWNMGAEIAATVNPRKEG